MTGAATISRSPGSCPRVNRTHFRPGGAVSHTHCLAGPGLISSLFSVFYPDEGDKDGTSITFVLISRVVWARAVSVSWDIARVINLCWSSRLPLSQLSAAFRQSTTCLWLLPDVTVSPHCSLQLFSVTSQFLSVLTRSDPASHQVSSPKMSVGHDRRLVLLSQQFSCDKEYVVGI